MMPRLHKMSGKDARATLLILSFPSLFVSTRTDERQHFTVYDTIAA